ncbi:RecA/RadA recombinase [Desulfohalotomaculum tongense]|nr:RecA/RadA recombinase [Desulforadius tongensis]
MKFYSTLRLDVKKGQKIKGKNAEIIGSRVKIKVTKNKVAPPFRQTEVDLYYGEGISRETCLLDLGEKYKVIEGN